MMSEIVLVAFVTALHLQWSWTLGKFANNDRFRGGFICAH